VSSASARPSLTGAYYADDGGYYYIVEGADGTITWAGLHNSGFHKGIEFANVFRGQIQADGVTITGDWVDVPRGMGGGGGTLVIEILPAIDPIQLQHKPDGSFGATLWTQDLPGSRTPVQLSPQDIVAVEKQVRRYDTSVFENNPPARDFTVAWGQVSTINWPTLPPEPANYCTFCTEDNWDGDGDFDFDLKPDLSHMGSDFGQRTGSMSPGTASLSATSSWGSWRSTRCSIARPRCTAARTRSRTAPTPHRSFFPAGSRTQGTVC